MSDNATKNYNNADEASEAIGICIDTFLDNALGFPELNEVKLHESEQDDTALMGVAA